MVKLSRFTLTKTYISRDFLKLGVLLLRSAVWPE